MDLRHWTAGACRRAGLSKQASALLMGHDAASGDAMRDWYDSPPLEDALAEQMERLPRGPLGILEPPEVKLLGGLTSDTVALVQAYLSGEVGTMEFATRMEGIRLHLRPVKSPGILEP